MGPHFIPRRGGCKKKIIERGGNIIWVFKICQVIKNYFLIEYGFKRFKKNTFLLYANKFIC